MGGFRVFLLSPAYCGGKRAQLLAQAQADFELARRLRGEQGAELGEVFSFLSGLYFRGKLAYAYTFARPPTGAPGALVITPGRGLVAPSVRIGAGDLEELAAVPVDLSDPRYRLPLERDARHLAATLGSGCHVVLLGSVASGKYVEILLDIFGEDLRFPAEFVGRGDMSRGGLMLRRVEDGRELEYVPVHGTPRRGPRPPRLEPR